MSSKSKAPGTRSTNENAKVSVIQSCGRVPTMESWVPLERQRTGETKRLRAEEEEALSGGRQTNVLDLRLKCRPAADLEGKFEFVHMSGAFHFCAGEEKGSTQNDGVWRHPRINSEEHNEDERGRIQNDSARTFPSLLAFQTFQCSLVAPTALFIFSG